MNTIMLVDGHSIAFRAFYGQARNGNLTAPDGTPTGAVYGFLNILQRYLTEYEPSHLAVLFDESDPTFRTEQYLGYKANRGSMPEDLAVQMPILYDVLKAMNVFVYSMPGFEADDLIGTLAKRFGVDADSHVYILSGDKDDLQLVDENISQVYPRNGGGSTLYTPTVVFEEFGLKPIQIIDLKALMGDSSDNIPGVKGVGVKTATRLLKQYGTIGEIYENIDDIKGSAKKNLIEGEDSAYLSYELATIDTQVDFECTLAGISNREVNVPELTEIFVKLGFNSMIDRFGLRGEAKEYLAAEAHEYNLLACSYLEVLAEFSDAKAVAVGLYQAGEKLYISFSKDSENLYILDTDKSEAVDLLQQLNAAGVLLISYDFKDVFKELDFYPLRNTYDISIAGYLLGVEMDGKTDAEILASLNGTTIQSYKINNQGNFDLGPNLIEFANLSIATLHIHEKTKNDLIDIGSYDLAVDIEFPLVAVLAEMENTGISVDADILAQLSLEFSETAKSLEEKIFAEAGHEFNINSPKQLSTVLFDEMGIQSGKKTSTGAYSTAASVLEDLAPLYPIIEYVLRYRTVTKLQSTFTDGLAKEIESDGKIRTNFHQKLTTTGRLSSSDPNLQNIPNRGEEGRQIRKAFVPEDGYVFLDADYSQIELRLLAVLSQDQNLLKTFKEGGDVHTITAASIFNVDESEVTPAQRDVGKTINFSIVYGISDFGLSQDLKITVGEAKEYIDHYYELYSGAKPYMDGLVKYAYEHGYVETYFSRRRYIPELKDRNFNRRKFGERVAINSPIQGTAADLMKLAMVNFQEELNNSDLDARILLQVHDEILVEVKESDLEACKDLLKNTMESVATLEIPLDVDLGVGKNWYESK